MTTDLMLWSGLSGDRNVIAKIQQYVLKANKLTRKIILLIITFSQQTANQCSEASLIGKKEK